MRFSDGSSDVCSSDLETLERFAAEGVDLLVVDGGDGTVRDVISAAPAAFGDRMPRMAILPSGKTNALALDLGVPLDWAVADVVEAAARGQFVRRAPIEIYRDGADQPDVRGFLRSEEHTSELQSPMSTSYAVFCLKKTTTLQHSH